MQQSDSISFLKETVPQLLNQLSDNTQAKWGIMRPQHMVEHLSVLFYFSSKDRGMKVIRPAEELGLSRDWLHTDDPFPRFIEGAGLKVGETEKLRFADLDEAKGRFLKGLHGFFDYFDQNPDSSLIHPVFDDLNYAEWLQFHHKHIIHHFTQFGLIEE